MDGLGRESQSGGNDFVVLQQASISEVVVVIPARNEGALVQQCLDALALAALDVRVHAPDVRLHSVVVLDSCTDQTADVVAADPEVTAVSAEYANVGASRALGVLLGLSVVEADASSVWIANTDADSRVPVNWLTTQLRIAASGVDAILGSVQPNLVELTDREVRAWHAVHPTGPSVGTVHGTNLGVRASTYLQLGGFTSLTEHEDVDLVSRLRASGARVQATGAIPVRTSARKTGRTPGGYAGYVRDLVNVQYADRA